MILVRDTQKSMACKSKKVATKTSEKPKRQCGTRKCAPKK